jgi:hypothetical protein
MNGRCHIQGEGLDVLMYRRTIKINPILHGPQKTRRTRWVSSFILYILAILLLGCDETVNPNLNLDRPFTLWGIINPKADTHAVRIFEIEPGLRLIPPELLDIGVTSTELQSGRRSIWQDSVIQLPDGDYRHVFWAVFEAKAGDTFHLEVRRSDGATSSATATVPPPIQIDILDPNLAQVREILLPVLIQGDPPALPRIEVAYNVNAINATGTRAVTHQTVVSYDSAPELMQDGLLLNIDLVRDLGLIATELKVLELPKDRISLQNMTLHVHVGNAEWVSPVGFDPNLVIEPGLLSNIENGFGFLGAGYIESTSWRPPRLLLGRAGWDVN